VRQFAALSLDLDETLLDGSGLQESIVATCRQVAATYSLLDARQLLAANTQAWSAYWPAVESTWTLGGIDGAAVALEAWRRTLAACGCVDPAITQFAAQTHAALVRQTQRRFDDVSGLLEAARSAAIPLVLITNGASDTQRGKLEALDLECWFDAVIVSAEVGAAKPEVAVFKAALEHLDVAAQRVWHVGDSLVTDVAGANAAGMVSVWLNRTGDRRLHDAPRPHLEIRSLAELFYEPLRRDRSIGDGS